MGYLHIENLYQNQDILLFKECYALEKIHGTSAHITWKSKEKRIHIFSGGTNHAHFSGLFDTDKLTELFAKECPNSDATIYGEAYGGSINKGAKVYGEQQRFIAFDVKINEMWLDVPKAENFCKGFDIDFVDYVKAPTDVKLLDFERDKPSVQATRNGIESPQVREGVILRPLIELTKNNGDRLIAKHKAENFKETKTQREVSPEKLAVLEDAKAIAEEWVTPMRLIHVLDKLPQGINMNETKTVILAMIEDVYREGKNEIVESKEATSYIGSRTAKLFKEHLQAQLA